MQAALCPARDSSSVQYLKLISRLPAVFLAAPSVPVINTERCSVMWDSATLRWSSAKASPGLTYTLEYCRQCELEGEGLRSISGIKACEQKVVLQPNENYLFYIKAVNEAGASEQSEAALISTKGTRFQLLKSSAHPALTLSDDYTTLQFSHDAHHANAPTNKECRYQLLHNRVQSSVFVTETPERVGAFLDHQLSCLSFYNACSGQLLGTFTQRFSQPCHPALALEQPGSLQVCMVPDVPEFTKS
ncbi:hypothetical protein GOODEAATRI_011349 [Goodea atripinnis]|uniref:Fibronectin type-III domain-containing protein n=1 Tax=Goodea atripinnis TaxID=208336 RepID=A0ABV0MR88_9TELE